MRAAVRGKDLVLTSFTAAIFLACAPTTAVAENPLVTLNVTIRGWHLLSRCPVAQSDWHDHPVVRRPVPHHPTAASALDDNSIQRRTADPKSR